MSVMISDDKKELVVTCKCGCQDTIHIKVDDEDKDADYYAIQTILSGNWYRDQDDTVIRCIRRKLKKIWAIIRNKDYYYSDVLMSREDFRKYKEYINQFQENKNMDYTCENCKSRHTWDCDDGGVMRKCSDFELDESTLSSEEQRLLRVMRQVMSEKLQNEGFIGKI